MSPPEPKPLPALPAPGLALHSPNYIAQTPTLLLVKESSGNWSTKNALTVTRQGGAFLEGREEQRREMVFRTPSGHEVLRVKKQVHEWSGRGEEYHGMRPDGSRAWHVKLHRGLTGTDYRMWSSWLVVAGRHMQVLTLPGLTIFPTPRAEQTMLVKNKVLEQEKGVLWNGYVVTTMSMHQKWKHLHREDLLNIAPGMDILLALGVCYVRYDKQKTDAKTASDSVDTVNATVDAAAGAS